MKTTPNSHHAVWIGGMIGIVLAILTFAPRIALAQNALNASGNVGIGTTTPHRLVTISDPTAPVIGFDETGAATTTKRWVEFANGGSFYFQTMNDDDTSGNTWLKVNRSGNVATSIVFPNGNVGIGTTNPDSHLTVSAATTAVTSIQATGTIGGTRSILQLINPASSGNGWDFGYNLDLSSQNFTVRELTNGATSTRLTIQKTTVIWASAPRVPARNWKLLEISASPEQETSPLLVRSLAETSSLNTRT